MSNKMLGIDISHWQKGLNIKEIDIDFVIIKATQGIKFVDSEYPYFIKQAEEKGIKIGLYHYFSGTSTGKEQAHFFLKTVGNNVGKHLLALDWETKQNPQFINGQNAPYDFLHTIYIETGVKPLIYMSKSVCRDYDWNKVVDESYGLWVAQYANYNIMKPKTTPWTDNKGTGDFKNKAIFQYSSRGRIEGYEGNLDLNVAYMSPTSWDKYAKVK